MGSSYEYEDCWQCEELELSLSQKKTGLPKAGQLPGLFYPNKLKVNKHHVFVFFCCEEWDFCVEFVTSGTRSHAQHGLRCVNVHKRSPLTEMIGQQEKKNKKTTVALRLGSRSNSPWREHMFSPRTCPILRCFYDIDPGLMSTLCNLLHDIEADSKNWLPNPLLSGLHAQLREPKTFYGENQKHLYKLWIANSCNGLPSMFTHFELKEPIAAGLWSEKEDISNLLVSHKWCPSPTFQLNSVEFWIMAFCGD